jgi:hypothetical protein
MQPDKDLVPRDLGFIILGHDSWEPASGDTDDRSVLWDTSICIFYRRIKEMYIPKVQGVIVHVVERPHLLALLERSHLGRCL